jgi:hypothetical protein
MITKRPLPGQIGSEAGGVKAVVGQRPFTNTRSENQAPLRQSVANQALPARMLLAQWRPLNNGALRGRASLVLPIGLRIDGVCVFRTAERGVWASLPSEPLRDASGTVLRNDEGKPRHRSAVQWVSPQLQRRWSDQVIALIRDQYGAAAFEGER